MLVHLRDNMWGFVSDLSMLCAVMLLGIQLADTQTLAPDVCPELSNTSCEKCVSRVNCLWCISTQQCVRHSMRTMLPSNSVCPLNEARWGVCWVNFKVLIISSAVLVGAILATLLVCCVCLCKCARVGEKNDKKVVGRTPPRRARPKNRKTGVQFRHDEIREKYGVTKSNPYSRMDGK